MRRYAPAAARRGSLNAKSRRGSKVNLLAAEEAAGLRTSPPQYLESAWWFHQHMNLIRDTLVSKSS